jgi:hypothetical protein
MDSTNAIIVAVGLLAACLVAVLLKVHVSRNGTPVEQWARRHGYKLISEEREVSASVRIMGMPREMMQVFRVVVRDSEGRTRKGRLEWTGSALDAMHVRWEE